MIQRQLHDAQIFSAFNDQERFEILTRLGQYKGLVPSLHAFFRNWTYWEACLDSMRHLVNPLRRDTVLTALERQFTGINQQEGQVVIQVNESNFTTVPGSSADQIEFGCRHIVAFAMRHFVEIPRTPSKEDVLGKARPVADTAVLSQYANLATRLGFESPKIADLIMGPHILDPADQPGSPPPQVTSGCGEDVEHRCGLPRLTAFEEDRDSLFVHNLDNDRDECGEGITSFFVRRWVYLDFLGPTGRTVALPSASRAPEGQEHARQDQAQQQREAREWEAREVQRERERDAREREAQRQQEAREREAREREAREREAREQEAREQVAQERGEEAQRELEAREREQRETREAEDRRVREDRERLCICFKIRERGVWRDVQSLWVKRSDPSEVARVARKNMRKGFRIFDTNMRLLGPDQCFEVVTADGTNTILLMPESALNIDDRVLDSASVLSYEAIVDSVKRTRRD